MSNVSKAMIMSAGVGSRLDPLTKYVPKPLVPIANKPVMDILFENLYAIGIKDVICNTYYLADEIIERYSNNNIGINFNYVKESTLSGTAGGVKKCQHFFNKGETFIVLSADGVTNADILKGIQTHKKSKAIATMGIKQIDKSQVSHFGVVVTDTAGFVQEFQEKPSIEDAKSNFINTGIYIFDYEIFNYIPENTFYDFAKNVFPELLKKHAINTFEVTEYWSDIGTLEQYKQSTQDLFNGKYEFKHSPIQKSHNGAFIADDCSIDSTAEFVGNSTVGKGSVVGANTIIEDSIIWDNVKIGRGLHISNSVIASNSVIEVNISNKIIEANSNITLDFLKV